MKSIIGKWEIIETSLWDKDFIDLIDTGCIEFKKKGLGELSFGAVFAEIDYRISDSEPTPLIEFSFSGQDEGDPISGRAKLSLQGKKLVGKIFFHYGDEAEMMAEPFKNG